jgi:hypothetical protein
VVLPVGWSRPATVGPQQCPIATPSAFAALLVVGKQRTTATADPGVHVFVDCHDDIDADRNDGGAGGGTYDVSRGTSRRDRRAGSSAGSIPWGCFR